MFRSCFTIFVLVLLVFVSSLNALQCVGSGLHPDECSACTGFICKTPDGNRIDGTSCTEEINNYCQLGLNEEKIKSIAQETGFQSENGKYFVFSCQISLCNFPHWSDEKIAQYQKEIKDAGLEQPKNDGKTICTDSNGKSIDCNLPFPGFDETPGCWDHPGAAEKLNKLSGGLACIRGDYFSAKQSIVCQSTGCTCWTEDGTEAECDNLPKTFAGDCDTVTENQKEKFAKDFDKFCSSSGNSNDGSGGGADKKSANENGANENGAETIGYGFALLMASLFLYFNF